MSSLSSRVFSGAIWSIAMRWSVRAIGLVSTLILVRLLEPEDFGVIAMATLAVGLVEVVFDFGVVTVLIRNPDSTEEDYSTAWTIRVIQGSVAALVLLAFSPLAVQYFDEPRITSVLYWLALMSFITGFQNIGIVDFQKNLELNKDYYFLVGVKVISFLATITAAFLLKSYWALVIGILFGKTASVVISYVVHPFRPRFTLSRAGYMWHFSKWLLLQNVGSYAQYNLDAVIVGGRASPGDLGIYNIASEIASMPTSEAITPLGRVLLPGFSKIQNDTGRVRDAFKRALSVILILGLPIAIGVALVAENLVPVILGAKWMAAIPIIKIIALVSTLYAIRYIFGTILAALGHFKVVAFAIWGQIILFILAAVLIIPTGGMEAVAFTRFVVSAIFTIILLFYTMHLNLISVAGLLTVSWRPVVATSSMAMLLTFLGSYLPFSDIFILSIKVVVGVLIYCASLIFLWFLSGSPDSGEKYILDRMGFGK